MAGIYFHIPFCRQACHYCDFHFTVNGRGMDGMVHAMGQEMRLREGFFGSTLLSTVYFGGGTPSFLPAESIAKLLDTARSTFHISTDAEITLEANPDDITAQNLTAWKAIGINRLSIGIQSFKQEHLTWMNRSHSAEQALKCILLAQEYGFHNLSIDLIFGIPSLTDEEWAASLAKAASLGVPHISCYGITVEPHTPLARFIEKGSFPLMDDAASAAQFQSTIDILCAKGYAHYELSNYALPGWHSRHNSAYWSGEPYLGIGPSAHSFRSEERMWNVRSNSAYVRAIEAGHIPCEVERLTTIDRLNEAIMLGLRTMEGLSKERLDRISEGAWADLLARSTEPIESGLLLSDGDRMRLSGSGKLFADRITGALFFAH